MTSKTETHLNDKLLIGSKMLITTPRAGNVLRHFMKLILAAVLFWSGICTSEVVSDVLTLEVALDAAFDKSPTVIQARNSLESARKSLDAEQASLKSQFNLDLMPFRYSRSRIRDDLFQEWFTNESKSSSADFRIDQRIKWTDAVLSLSNSLDWSETSSESDLRDKVTSTTYRNNISLTLTQPLFTYNRTMQTLNELELDYEDSQLRYTLEKLRIERTVTTQFYRVYRNLRSLEISREEYQNKEESYNIIKNKVEAGISAQEELFQAEVDFARSRAQLENADVTYENSLDELKILLGFPIEAEIELAVDIAEMVVEVDLGKAVESGLKYSPELRQMEIDIEKAKFDLNQIGAEDEFRADLGVTYGILGTNEEFSNIYDDPIRSQTIAVTLNVPLWDWGKKRSRLDARELLLDNQNISKDDEVNQIKLSIRKTYRELQNKLNQIEIANKSMQNARLTYEINLERYKNGDISSKDIGEYQTQLSNEQLNQIEAVIDYRLELLNMKIESLWDFENDRPVIELDRSTP